MKLLHLLSISALLAITVSCKQDQAPAIDSVSTVEASTPIINPDAAHNSENSLDWPGTYIGTTPCSGDCTGIATNIKIEADSTYNLSVQAIGQEDKPRLFAGKFYWDTAKNVITLDAEGDHLKFKVQEGSLKMLDKFGDPKQGGPQSVYVLKKQ